MFDGLASPRVPAGPAPSGLVLDPTDPINRGRLLLLPLNETGTYAEASHNTYVRALSPAQKLAQVVNSTSKLITQRGFAYSTYNHPSWGGGVNQFVTLSAPAAIQNKNKAVSIAISVYLTNTTNKGTHFHIGASGTGYGIVHGASDNDNNGTNILLLFQNIRYVNTSTSWALGWNDVLFTLDQNGFPSVYHQGKLIYTDTGAVPIAPGSSAIARVGADHVPARYTNGAAYQAASIWDRALTAAEARRLARDRFAGASLPAARLFFGPRASTTSNINGTLSATLAAATLSATGTVALKGTTSATLADATLTSTGALALKGAVAVTLDAATLAATGSTGGISGTLSATLANATLVSTGTLALKGTATATLAAATVVATGTVALKGTTSATLSDATLSATGAVAIKGSVSATLAAATLSATGTSASVNTGAVAVTLANATLAATGTLALRGTTTTTLANATLSATGTLQLRASVSVTLANATLSATGTNGNVVNKVVLVWNGVRI